LDYLVEHACRLITRDELLNALWPDTFVQPEVLKSRPEHIWEDQRDEREFSYHAIRVKASFDRVMDVLRALKESNWVTGGPKSAAVRLGMKRTTLAYRIRKLNIPLPPGLMGTETTIATQLDGTIIAERQAPRDSFAGHQMSTPWDPLHGAYFNGEAREQLSIRDESGPRNHERHCRNAVAFASGPLCRAPRSQ
jgi:hypothetical protein